MSDEMKRTLYVEIVGANDLMPKDGQGSASPYCVLDYDSQRQQTETKVKELNPVWNAVLSFPVFDANAMDAQELRVSIFSAKKGIQRDPKFLGRVRIRGSAFAKKGEEAVVYYKLKRRNLFSQVKGEIGLKIWWVDEPLVPPPPEAPPAAPEAPATPPDPPADPSPEAAAPAPADPAPPAPEITPETVAAPPTDPAPAPPAEPPVAEAAPAPPAEPAPVEAAADKKDEPAPTAEPPANPAPTAEPLAEPAATPEPPAEPAPAKDKKDPEPAEKKDEPAAEAPDAAADVKKDEVAATKSREELIENEMSLRPVYWDHNLPYAYEVPWNNFIPSSVLDNPYVNLPRVEWV